jgi:hypothetical protein
MSSVFDLLGDEFSKDDLLCEILASDDDAGAGRAGGKKDKDKDKQDDFEIKSRTLCLQRTETQGWGTLETFRMTVAPPFAVFKGRGARFDGSWRQLNKHH